MLPRYKDKIIIPPWMMKGGLYVGSFVTVFDEEAKVLVDLDAVIVEGDIRSLSIGAQSDQSVVLQIAQHVEHVFFLREPLASHLYVEMLENGLGHV